MERGEKGRTTCEKGVPVHNLPGATKKRGRDWIKVGETHGQQKKINLREHSTYLLNRKGTLKKQTGEKWGARGRKGGKKKRGFTTIARSPKS